MRKKRTIAIDLFCGAGGMSLGFEQAGFNVVAAVDSDPIHVSTYSKNFCKKNVFCADLSSLSGQELRYKSKLDDQQIDVICGGPPCTGFSMIGKRRVTDPRNQLLVHFARLIKELKPNYFIVENVKGLLIHPMTQILDIFVNKVEKAGYSIVKPIRCLDAYDFGVPQRRSRVFILGYKNSYTAFDDPTPSSNFSGKNSRKLTNVWDAIGDLPNIDNFEELLAMDTYLGRLKSTPSIYAKSLRSDTNGLNLKMKKKDDGLTGCLRIVHTSKIIQRFSETKPGTYEPISRYYRLVKENPSPTLRAGSGRSYGSFTAPRPIHPVYPRCISVREGARIHSFPDWFQFHPTKWPGFRQVGNSVPPFLGRIIASVVMDVIK